MEPKVTQEPVTERQVRIQTQTLRDYGLPHSAAMLESLLAEVQRLNSERMDILNGAGAVVGSMIDAAYESIQSLTAERDTALRSLRDLVVLDDGDDPGLWGYEKEFAAARAILSSSPHSAEKDGR